jgi:glycosyltransferase involved in cell wall biosynthesis
MRIGLSALCVDPRHKTGLPTLFSNFVREAVRLFPDVEFVVFEGRDANIAPVSDRVQAFHGFPAADKRARRFAAEYFQVGPEARRRQCDVLMTNSLVPIRCHLPVAMHLLSMHHLSAANRIGGVRTLYRALATRRGLDKADLIITNTRFACEQILAVEPAVAPKLLQSYEGIDHQVIHAVTTDEERTLLKKRFGVAAPYFLWCSNFYPYKNAEALVTAYCELPSKVRDEVPLVMVGGGNWGGCRDRALDLARSHGAERSVKMLGWVDDGTIPILFRNASVFVHPSKEETFGRSVIEAMASGVPCVVHDIPVMREVTEGHVLLVDYGDRHAAADAMLRALQDSELRARLVTTALARAKEFSFERLAMERVDALRRLLDRSYVSTVRYPAVYADSFTR